MHDCMGARSRPTTKLNPDNTPVSPILPGAWLGMVGGGQLGRMFCFAAQAMGYRVAVLDPDENEFELYIDISGD